MMDAELAYLFRHGLIRDAAYELQTPSTRAALHELALQLLESVLGGAPAWHDPDKPLARHATDPYADELAFHAKAAQSGGSIADQALAKSEALYLWRAAAYAEFRANPLLSIEYYQKLAAHHAAPPAVRGLAARSAGWLLHTIGRSGPAREILEGALTDAEAAGLEHERARVMGSLGLLLQDTGQLEESRAMLERALELQRGMGLRSDESRTLTYLANVASKTGLEDKAVEMYRQALVVAREVGDRRGQGVALANLGPSLAQRGELTEAESVYREALALQREIGNRRVEGIVLGNLANLLDTRGDYASAEEIYTQAITLHNEYGNQRSAGFALGNLAGLYAATGRPELAEKAYQKALATHAQVGARWSLAVHRCDYALFILRKGDGARARELWLQGADSLREMGDTGELSRKADAMRNACEACAVAPFAHA